VREGRGAVVAGESGWEDHRRVFGRQLAGLPVRHFPSLRWARLRWVFFAQECGVTTRSRGALGRGLEEEEAMGGVVRRVDAPVAQLSHARDVGEGHVRDRDNGPDLPNGRLRLRHTGAGNNRDNQAMLRRMVTCRRFVLDHAGQPAGAERRAGETEIKIHRGYISKQDGPRRSICGREDGLVTSRRCRRASTRFAARDGNPSVPIERLVNASLRANAGRARVRDAERGEVVGKGAEADGLPTRVDTRLVGD